MTMIEPLQPGSLDAFVRDTDTFVEQLLQTGRPQLLTVNGSAPLIVQDAASYQRLLTALDRAESIVAIREGLDSMHRGEGIPIEEAFEQLRVEWGLPEGIFTDSGA